MFKKENGWLPYIYGRGSLEDQQNQNFPQSNVTEPKIKFQNLLEKFSKAQLTINKRIIRTSKASFGKKSVKTEKRAVLEEKFGTSLRKMD